MINVIFYHTPNGDCPIKNYLDSLSPKLRVKTMRSIMLLDEFGTELRLPYSRPLGDGIFELRSISGSNITRVLFFYQRQYRYFNSWFHKKTAKNTR